jgi:hypothetical protein
MVIHLKISNHNLMNYQINWIIYPSNQNLFLKKHNKGKIHKVVHHLMINNILPFKLTMIKWFRVVLKMIIILKI